MYTLVITQFFCIIFKYLTCLNFFSTKVSNSGEIWTRPDFGALKCVSFPNCSDLRQCLKSKLENGKNVWNPNQTSRFRTKSFGFRTPNHYFQVGTGPNVRISDNWDQTKRLKSEPFKSNFQGTNVWNWNMLKTKPVKVRFMMCSEIWTFAFQHSTVLTLVAEFLYSQDKEENIPKGYYTLCF